MSSKLDHYAYGIDRAEVETVMRFAAVKRWHMIDTTRIQSLAEHSANVAALAYGIAKTAPGGYFGPAADILPCALFHDMAEVFTGDIPSHTKRRLSGVEEAERDTLPALWYTGWPPGAELLVKLCDLADGIRFIRIHGVDITAEHAQEGLAVQMGKKGDEAREVWPELIAEHVLNWAIFYAYEQG